MPQVSVHPLKYFCLSVTHNEMRKDPDAQSITPCSLIQNFSRCGYQQKPCVMAVFVCLFVCLFVSGTGHSI